MNQKAMCPVCGSYSINTFLRRRRVPVHQNLVMKDQKSATEIARGNLNMAVCKECGFIFNRAFELSKLSYGELYDNSQACSAYFNEHLDRLARYLIFEKNVRNCRIVEAGCGDGSFLRKLVEIGEAGNYGYGFDPSYVGPLSDLKGRLKFEKRYYEELAGIRADVAICRHVIEHVPHPVTLLHTIRQALANSPHAKVFFETPCTEWIPRNQVIWDFFYEHCSYFTAESLITLFEDEGFSVQSVRHVFGGQYLWLEATISHKKMMTSKKPDSSLQLTEAFAASESEVRKNWEIEIQKLASKGKVAIWGAGAKGVTLANLIDPDRILIDCVVDLNPNKQGKYIPGTGHPIVDYQEIASRGVATAILMNPNYRGEIQALLNEAHLDVDLLG